MGLDRNIVVRMRALQTECLPYEAPLEVSTHWLYSWLERSLAGLSEKNLDVRIPTLPDRLLAHLLGASLNDSTSNNYRCKIKSLGKTGWRAPMNISARRPRSGPRSLKMLSIASQMEIARIYYLYSDALVDGCGRDSHSLRYPTRPNPAIRSVLADTTPQNDDPQAVSTEKRILDRYTSYFRYDRYAYVGQFFESSQWLALEGRWRILERTDVANCFGTIYTHSISWHHGSTLLGKANLKGARKDIADIASVFDKSMQCAQWGETHGIPVGPEASRIFAEVVFQGIDRAIDVRLAASSLVSGRDYEYLRYMDDYFIFANDSDVAGRVADTIAAEIRENGMAINSSKSIRTELPFSTKTSLRKDELKRLLRTALPKEGSGQMGSRSVHTAMKLVMLSEGEVDLTGSALAQIESAIHRYLARSKTKTKTNETALPDNWIEIVWPFIESSTAQYLGRPSVPSALKIVRVLRDFWITCQERGGTDRYTGSEYVRFTVERIIKRIAPLQSTELELCHFLSLASACDLDLGGATDALILARERSASIDISARSEHGSLLLLLSLLSHRLKFTTNPAQDDQVNQLVKDLKRQADSLFAVEFTGSAVKSHCAQELMLLSIASCRRLTRKQRLSIIDSPWVRKLFEEISASNTSSQPSRRTTSRALYRFVCELDDCDHVFGFDWDMRNFDNSLLEKTPQFVY